VTPPVVTAENRLAGANQLARRRVHGNPTSSVFTGGVEAQLVVFEALPRAFWNNPELPESKEADQLMAGFFDHHLGK
jgi:hypothetical protein